ncbi:hypothetical protein SAMN04487962_101278 [Marinobacter segnicrescens]|uniref:Uncharacterized protein n=1 Tax=Marinobacter segnicrescens TaxID=430453 RepID=A0A1H9YPT9_9GAMM|nr:hypothetical protein SAMN04487962_101278 [Marinobacter segnicrescens]
MVIRLIRCPIYQDAEGVPYNATIGKKCREAQERQIKPRIVIRPTLNSDNNKNHITGHGLARTRNDLMLDQ